MTDNALAAGIFAVWMTAGFGWVMNVAKIFWSMQEPLTGEFALRVIGAIVFPIGCVLGWL